MFEGQNNYWKKTPVSYEDIFLKIFLAKSFLRKKNSSILPAEEIFEPKTSNFLETIGNFTSKFLDHLIIELKSVQDEAYPFPVMDDAYCCTYTRLCSLMYSHMHRVTQTLPQEP